MKDITKEKLLTLGFEEEYSPPIENPNEIEYYYYTYNINGECLLISDANDENNGNFTVEFFEINEIQITNYEDLKKLMEILKRNIINNE